MSYITLRFIEKMFVTYFYLFINDKYLVVVEKDNPDWNRTSNFSFIHFKFLVIKFIDKKKINNRKTFYLF